MFFVKYFYFILFLNFFLDNVINILNPAFSTRTINEPENVLFLNTYVFISKIYIVIT